MPSGYAAATVWAIALILWWSGWRREVADGLPKSLTAAFLVLWPLLARLNVPLRALGGELALNAGLLATAAFAAAAGAWIGRSRAGTAAAAGLLVASIILFADRLAEGAPTLLPEGARWIVAAVAAVVTALLVRGAAEQIVALTIGLALPEALPALWHLPASGEAAVGDPAWADRWWLAFAGARAATAAARLPRALSVARSHAGTAVWAALRKRQWRRGGERS